MPDRELSLSQAAWNAFADKLKEVGEKITAPTGAQNERERAEGYRYLVRMISAGHELAMEVNRSHPELRPWVTPTRKLRGDGPDTLYHEARLDEKMAYRLSVRRGDDIYFSATVYAYLEDRGYTIVDHLHDHEIVWQHVFGQQIADIQFSAERLDGAENWIRLAGPKPLLFVRQYYPECVRAVQAGRYREAVLNMECLSDVETPPPYSEKAFADELDQLIEYIEEGTDASIGLSVFAGLNRVEYKKKAEAGRRVEATHIREGELVVEGAHSDDLAPEDLAAMLDPRLIGNNLPGPGLQYIGAWFHLREDEAILIEGHHVPCRYWCCQILTRYMESGDYRYHTVSLNDRQVKRANDNAFRIYASPTNPGVENWFSTQGYQNGHILLRVLLPETPMEAKFSVVKIADIP